MLIVYSTVSAFSQTVSPDISTLPQEKPFEMLVIGDSIIWGQGHKGPKDFTPEEIKSGSPKSTKFSYMTKDWLETVKFNGKRRVNMFVKAHSGASITEKKEGNLDPNHYFDGEINLWTPSITRQYQFALDCYQRPTNSADCYQKSDVSRDDLSFYQGKPVLPENVDLILLDGCINDMSPRQIFNIAFSKDKLKQAAEKYCNGAMSELLTNLAKDFPNAKILVTGYYPLVSKKTDPLILYKALLTVFGKNFVSSTIIKVLNILKWKKIDKIHFIRNELAERSSVWYQASVAGLLRAVNNTNSGLSPSPPRIFYVDPAFREENAFSASQTFMWKLIAKKRTDDPLFKKRLVACNNPEIKHFKRTHHFICHRAGLFHPNIAGADAYYQAVVSTLDKIQF